VQPEILAHHPLNTVSRNCVAHLLADGKPEAKTAVGLIPFMDEQDEIFGKMLPALFITQRKLWTFEQPTLLVPS